ncbi:MAG TPA: carboxymuconolactone decarboxylase family protein [Baekduia sp.]|uniref:carboxymuconolactone decarboxylase family protein n=1 Tax=Baekduia sp. TaxID=2600305 RepID=UPI002BF26F21|nr:carboxymuconolactone decarboxylase family protein [Baekduia sp.]HMJ34215.1 carboxymuconolactone decarboxylase family protein [Baekduia sp.]
MTRVAPATGLQAKLVAALARRRYGPPIVESTLVFARHPRLLRWFAAYNRAVERPGRVPRRLAELAVLEAARVVACEFCLDIGSEYARRAGLRDEQLLALHDAERSGLFDDDELLVIGYGRAMSVTPPEVTDEQVAALRERYGDEGVLELTHLIAWENARARTNTALDIGAGGFSSGRLCAGAAPSPRSPPTPGTR